MSVFVVGGNNADKKVLCVICLNFVSLSDVTAGSLYADGHQAFACNAHLNDRTKWIGEWALFDAKQQQAKNEGKNQ